MRYLNIYEDAQFYGYQFVAWVKQASKSCRAKAWLVAGDV